LYSVLCAYNIHDIYSCSLSKGVLPQCHVIKLLLTGYQASVPVLTVRQNVLICCRSTGRSDMIFLIQIEVLIWDTGLLAMSMSVSCAVAPANVNVLTCNLLLELIPYLLYSAQVFCGRDWIYGLGDIFKIFLKRCDCWNIILKCYGVSCLSLTLWKTTILAWNMYYLYLSGVLESGVMHYLAYLF
jgi:hypothetical protein